MWENLVGAVALLAQPQVILIALISAVFGMFMGAVPGLTATMGMALLVPFTFFMDQVSVLVAVISMSGMAIFAGDIPGTLVRIPGTPSSAAYVDDAFILTQQGKAARALGLNVLGSALGGIFGALGLMLAAPALARFASRFTSFEYFWLAVLGLSATVAVSQGSVAKNGLSLLIGLFLATIGIDITLGIPRFTFGNVNLLSGISFIPAMVGLFGVSEVIRVTMEEFQGKEAPQIRFGLVEMIRNALDGLRARVRLFIQSGLTGVLVGALPGAGADIAAWVSYGFGKNTAKEPEKFGKGSEEAIISGTSANNAALAGTWIPALVFGIPGDSITAILLGVLMMKGIRPGPGIFENQGNLVYAIYLAFILANLLLIPLGWVATRTGLLMLRVPKRILMPCILLFCIVGAYAINNSMFDVGVMLVMGILGYMLQQLQVPTAPIVLGLILGPLMEQNFMMSVIKTQGSLAMFFTRPISAVLALLCLAAWLYPLYRKRRQARAAAAA
ncbi:MAG: tripartite tricarboxylate transporter permease [Firmicutes bacterium]|nr:tripartite tricarboxylate transporter permease [Bacillota bacterium]